MLQVELTFEESRLLYRILEGCLSDLRADMLSTDCVDFRDALRTEETFLKGLLLRLEPDAHALEPDRPIAR
jgi:hypothetical protein